MSTKRLRKKNQDKYNNNNIELSTNKLTPGIIKIFGDHVSQGSNYKAVRTSSISSAQEVVQVALQKYGLECCNPKDYVLCDVVGELITSSNEDEKKLHKKLKNKSDRSNNDIDNQPVWSAIYVRAINDIEKPLVLQSLWKPTNGKSRRFELRKKIEMENSCFYINTSVSMGRRFSHVSLFDYSDNSIEASNNIFEIGSPEVSHTNCDVYAESSPSNVPYLLLLKGYNPADKLVHRLKSTTTAIGPYMKNAEKQYDIILYTSDIILPVCFIHKRIKMDTNSEIDVDDLDMLILIEPINNSSITVDGSDISTTTLLKPGQLITIGENYLFLFKDPTVIKDVDLSLPWLNKIKTYGAFSEHPATPDGDNSGLINPSVNCSDVVDPSKIPSNATATKYEDKAIQVELFAKSVSFSQIDIETDEETDMLSDELCSAKQQKPLKSVVKSKLQLSYNIREEDSFLHTIIDITDEELEEFGVIPSYFFLMAIEHSAANFTDIQTRKLLLKISSGMQGIAWEKTKGIGKHFIKQQHPIVLLRNLLSELKVVLFWMTNTLEMLHYLQCNLKKYLLPRNQVGSNQEAILTADEELLSVLEEVIMFTFQQTIYHLTKVLYVALPLIIDDKPPVNVNHDQSVYSISQVFNEILCVSKNLHVHPQIITQLFAYLFFFSNASLFNSLIEKGPPSKLFSWDRGMQLKNNINVLGAWAKLNGLGSEYNQYMSSFLSAVDLLSTPKTQLVQCEWKQLREDYPSLTPAQLQLLLGDYQLNGEEKPKGWYPLPEDVERILRTNDLLESFATHPPLILPSSEFVLDLNTHPPNEQFSRYLCRLNKKFNRSKKDSNNVESRMSGESDNSGKSDKNKITKEEQI